MVRIIDIVYQTYTRAPWANITNLREQYNWGNSGIKEKCKPLHTRTVV